MGRPLPEPVLRELRQRGLLEGKELDEAWAPVLRDAELGKLLLERHGLVLGQDGDRLYARRVTNGL